MLEDWAVLRWIEQQHGTNDGSFHALSETIGTQPAVRRAYRIWVAELVDRDPGAADRLFSAAITEEGIPARFRDDTLVSLLRAPSSPAFLERHAVELLANDRDLLKRVIHLLRVACVTAPRWLSENAGRASLFNVPDGPAWAAVLKMVQTHFTAFTEPERLLLLGLVKDWSNGISWWEPYPAGAESAAAIAHRLLPGFDTYRSESAERQTLSVIARVPKADAAGFKALLRGGRENDGRDSTALLSVTSCSTDWKECQRLGILRTSSYPSRSITSSAPKPIFRATTCTVEIHLNSSHLQNSWGRGSAQSSDSQG